MALVVLQDTKKIYEACPSHREKVWQEIKNDHYNLDAEMEISEEKEKHKLRSWLRWLRRKIRKGK